MKYLLIKDGAIIPSQGDLGLEDMQRIVGGWNEHVTLRENTDGSVISLYCNEEGKLENLYRNFYLPMLADVIAGDAIVCATDENGETRDLTQGEIDAITLGLTAAEPTGWVMLPTMEVDRNIS